MNSLRARINVHAEKVRQHEEMEAALAGVFGQEAQEARDRFATLVLTVIKPAFHDFKTACREIGRDAVILESLPNDPVLWIAVTLCDRYLTFGVGKTLKLVNPKDDISKGPNAKFYEVSCGGDAINIRQKVMTDTEPIVTVVSYNQISGDFLDNELGGFFERAYPTPV